jgi:hypothetical protein
MYWAVVTLTSIGYGDYYPITAVGQLLTMVLAVAGLGMIALPAGILANGFSQKIKTDRKPRHRDAVGHYMNETGAHATVEGTDALPTEGHDTVPHFHTMDQVLRSADARARLHHLIEPLNHAEREALIALTAISLQEDHHS